MVEPPLTGPVEPEFADIQGIVRFGHGKLTEACFHLLCIDNTDAARRWLLNAPVTTAVTADPLPATALQVAFTASGLRRLEVPPDVLAAFSPEFLGGMNEPSRARRLGDVQSNRPEDWAWGGSEPKLPDLIVMLYARQGQLAALEAVVTSGPWAEAFHAIDRLGTFDIGDIEPFGFPDGVSQPQLDWQQTLAFEKERLAYGNVLALGEVLLGYRNEYGLHTDRPLVNPMEDERAVGLPPAEDVPERRDLGRNGSYLVFRQLQQDVRGFWRFMDQAAQSDPERRLALAEKMVGRRITGEPLVPLSDAPIPGTGRSPTAIAHNHFTYEDDPEGTRCPFGAHVRRANPRTADLPGGPQGLGSRLLRTLGFTRAGFREDLVAPSRFHRLLRRGREYGPELTPDEALEPAPEADEARGIHFICLAANIARQFEFVQNAWLASAKFAGLSDETDPILGNRVPLRGGTGTDLFSIPQPDLPPERVQGMPPFVAVRGGAYFFLPGIRALRYIAGGTP
jgi:deferrochelatase/peroxidase EfeB